MRILRVFGAALSCAVVATACGSSSPPVPATSREGGAPGAGGDGGIDGGIDDADGAASDHDGSPSATNDGSTAPGSPDASGPPPGEGGAAPDSGLASHTYEGREVLVHVPPAYAPGTPAPLVLMLHGCTQTPADFAAGTQMDGQADAAGFIVAYPAEPSTANAEECWNWFLPADQARGSGEPALLAAIVGDLSADYSIDAKRTFVAGLSAGAAMAVVLGATYPDVFAAIGVHSGLEYQAGTDTTSALTASASGGPDPKTQGDAAFAAMGSAARPVAVIVFHGDADGVVNVTNGQQVATQWLETDTRAGTSLGAPATTTGSAGGRSFTETTDSPPAPASPFIALYVVHGLGHAWSGGSSAGSFTDPNGPDASEIMWQFFSAHGR